MRKGLLLIPLLIIGSMAVAAQSDSDVFLDLLMGHNMLFGKTLDLLHIIKDQLFQLELKVVETSLTNNNCSNQPVSFWLSTEQYPYGKLHEIDGMLHLMSTGINKSLADGIDLGDLEESTLADANLLLAVAGTHEESSFFREAFECKCLAYKTLLGVNDTSVECGPIA